MQVFEGIRVVYPCISSIAATSLKILKICPHQSKFMVNSLDELEVGQVGLIFKGQKYISIKRIWCDTSK